MNSKPEDLNEVDAEERVPDEQSGFYFSTFIKIYDPNTQEILVQTRGDD